MSKMTKPRRGARLFLAGLCVVAGSLAFGSASAAAAEILVYQSSFDGSKTPYGFFTAGNVEVNQETGNVYVADPAHGAIVQFDAAGNPVDFPGTGSPTLTVPGAFIPAKGFLGSRGAERLAIDNSGTASQGNIYLLLQGGFAWGFSPDGKSLGPNWPLSEPEGYLCDITVSPAGDLYTNASKNGITLQGFTPAGVPTADKAEIDSSGCAIAFDELGNFYGGSLFSKIAKYDATKGFAKIGEISETHGPQLAIEPTTQDLYILQGPSEGGAKTIAGVRYTDPLVEDSTFERLTGFNSRGMAFAANGDLYVGEGKQIHIFHRQPTSAPIVKRQSVSKVRSTSAFLDTRLVAAGSPTKYHLEFGTDTSYGTILPAVDREIGMDAVPLDTSNSIEGLTPNTTYHFRVVATNAEGVTVGPDRAFTTFPTPPGGTDPCPNALSRKQTGARFLLDCRSYELVSAANTDGYDVESLLVPDERPFGGFPLASDPPKVLYGVHAGVIPGLGNPTNLGPDPYVATRGPGGWTTKYVGLPADLNPQAGPFSSVLGGADARLDSFAFAGPGICSPCFTTGVETGIPVRLPDGSLVQGMAGSLDPGAAAKSEGEIAKYFSADGSHLIFGSKARFEPDANGVDLTIYDRNLRTSTTQVVSKTPLGATMTGSDNAALDVSSDGSRIVVAQLVSSDAAGNDYQHPYMHIGASPNSVDLAPGASDGVLFAGMTSDGSKVFYSATDSLVAADTDSSADIYEAAVSPGGSLSLRLVTASSAGGCNPAPNSDGPHWNSVGATASCDAVAIGGGGGVASANGTVYFLSPEQLDGVEGVAGAPNLYHAAPGSAPAFVATLEPNNPLVRNSVAAADSRRTADFQVTPSGEFAVFGSTLPLAGPNSTGVANVYRYAASPDQLACPSCDPTRSEDPIITADADLAPDGLSLTDDGRVFFTTRTPLVLNDTGERDDVYQWSGEDPKLISSGIGSFDSRLLSASADGVDAYFFTHDKLSPEGRDGTQTRIYDARSGGGFFALPTVPQCSASDECHGAGTAAPSPPNIRTAAPGAGQNDPPKAAACKKGFVQKKGGAKKKGKCVKKQHKKKKSQKKTQRKAQKNA
jgi:hypothetical protein